MQGALAIGAAICAFLTIASPQAKAQGQSSVTIMQGAVVCLSHGDLVVFVNSGAMMPGCRRLALDTPSVQVGPADHGIVPVRAGASMWWVLEASIRRH
jgi:hypothetical protein